MSGKISVGRKSSERSTAISMGYALPFQKSELTEWQGRSANRDVMLQFGAELTDIVTEASGLADILRRRSLAVAV